jgi:hypothetical protein
MNVYFVARAAGRKPAWLLKMSEYLVYLACIIAGHYAGILSFSGNIIKGFFVASSSSILMYVISLAIAYHIEKYYLFKA